MSAVVIYDRECPLCLRAVDWLQKHAAPGALEYLACQSEERMGRFPEMPVEQCLEAMQYVAPDGQVFAAEQALPRICEQLRGWRWLARVLRLPGIRALSGPVYRFIARNRYVFSIVVARKSPEGAACGENACDAGEKEEAIRP